MIQETKNVELRGNVVLISSDGLRLETDRPRWDAEAQRAWTEDPVVIYRAGAVVHGTGSESKVAEEISSIKVRARAACKKGPALPGLAGQGGGADPHALRQGPA